MSYCPPLPSLPWGVSTQNTWIAAFIVISLIWINAYYCICSDRHEYSHTINAMDFFLQRFVLISFSSYCKENQPINRIDHVQSLSCYIKPQPGDAYSNFLLSILNNSEKQRKNLEMANRKIWTDLLLSQWQVGVRNAKLSSALSPRVTGVFLLF